LGTHQGAVDLEMEIQKNTRMSVYLKPLKTFPLGSFDTFLDTIKDNLQSIEKFNDFLNQCWRNKQIHRDDYSLIWVEQSTTEE